MSHHLNGKKVAILVTKGFEQVELTEPKRALDEAGAETKIVAPDEGKVKAWDASTRRQCSLSSTSSMLENLLLQSATDRGPWWKPEWCMAAR